MPKASLKVKANRWYLAMPAATTAVSFQIINDTDVVAFMTAKAVSDLPTNNPFIVDQRDAEFCYGSTEGQIAVSLTDLFLDLTAPLYFFFYCNKDCTITIRCN